MNPKRYLSAVDFRLWLCLNRRKMGSKKMQMQPKIKSMPRGSACVACHPVQHCLCISGSQYPAGHLACHCAHTHTLIWRTRTSTSKSAQAMHSQTLRTQDTVKPCSCIECFHEAVHSWLLRQPSWKGNECANCEVYLQSALHEYKTI